MRKLWVVAFLTLVGLGARADWVFCFRLLIHK